MRFIAGYPAGATASGTIVTCTNCSRSKSANSTNVNGRLTLQDGRAALGAPGGPAN